MVDQYLDAMFEVSVPKKGGTPDIPDEVYEAVRKKWLKDSESDDGYRNAAFSQSSGENK